MRGEKPGSTHEDAARHTFGGNIWGWRFSLLGLGLILLMLGIMFLRYMTMPEVAQIARPNIDTITNDSIKINQ